jgi:hypothetical protein
MSAKLLRVRDRTPLCAGDGAFDRFEDPWDRSHLPSSLSLYILHASCLLSPLANHGTHMTILYVSSVAHFHLATQTSTYSSIRERERLREGERSWYLYRDKIKLYIWFHVHGRKVHGKCTRVPVQRWAGTKPIADQNRWQKSLNYSCHASIGMDLLLKTNLIVPCELFKYRTLGWLDMKQFYTTEMELN